MAKAPSRRRRTNNLRRGVKRDKNRHHRHMHLSHAQVCFRNALQRESLYQGSVAYACILTVPMLFPFYAYARDNIGDDLLQGLVMTLLGVNLATFTRAVNNFNVCQRFDYILHDIPPEEEAELFVPEKQHIRFHSWTDQECNDKTNFGKDHLLRIYDCFGLQALADENHGFIKVPTGFNNQRGVPCYYNFHPEELFLYFMMRMKTGNDHTQMTYILSLHSFLTQNASFA